MEKIECETAFPLGHTIIHGDALRLLNPKDVEVALLRHSMGDWGNCSPEREAANERALHEGRPLQSAYIDRSGIEFWIITSADRAVTAIMVAEH